MSEEMTQTTHFENPVWFDGKKINEAMFCEEFLREYPMVTVNGAFFTVNGRVHDENRMKKVIYDRIKCYVISGIAKKVANLLDVMRMYEIVAPNGKVHTPPPGNCWKVVEPEFKKALADGRVTFGSDGNGVPRRKQFLSEAKGIVPWTWWPQDEVGHTGESKDEVNALFGSDISFDTPKPERLIERIIHIASNPGDLVLDSFLGSGTTAAVAQKMGRRWIGVEMGNHAYTHCKVRMDKVIAGEDPGGITKAQNWQGGGGYRFYEVAPTLINKDSFDEYVINEDYDANMLAAAVALHEGFRYHPDGDLFWKQSVGNENSYLFVTTRHLNSPYLDSIKDTMEEGEYLIIACRSFDSGLDKAYDNITVKKIPQMLLERCEFGKADYNLNIVHPPVYDDCDEEEEDV